MTLKFRHVVIVAVLVWIFHATVERHKLRQAIEAQTQTAVLTSTNFGEQPDQTDTTRQRFDFKGFHILPLAEFSIRARVLSRENYVFDEGAKLSPMDLALGWQRMADPQVYKTLNITQGGRWYRYSWHHAPPLPLQEIIESSANMHMIPASESVERILQQAQEGRFVRLKGYLVEVTRDDGWRWRSSLTRSDSGGGSCELIFVEAVIVE